MTERITSARELSAYLVARLRRDGTLPEGIWFTDGELILPIGPELDRFCEMVKQLRQSCDRGATSLQHDFADFANQLNRSDDDWRELSEIAVNDERKANRARERALKRSRRNTKSPKKKGKRR